MCLGGLLSGMGCWGVLPSFQRRGEDGTGRKGGMSLCLGYKVNKQISEKRIRKKKLRAARSAFTALGRMTDFFHLRMYKYHMAW